MGQVDETYINKEKHFLYLHWKGNDRDDTRSILTVLLLHFISDTRVEQVTNKVYRASQGPSRPRSMAYYDTIGIFYSIY